MILVTGGAGYIGSHTVHQLLEQGEKVIVLDNLCSGFRWAVPAGVEFIEGSCGDRELVESLLKKYQIQSIVHFAASLSVEESVYNPGKYYFNNVVNSLNLIDVAVKNHVKHFIFSSTSAVYGDVKVFPIREDSEVKPTSPYGQTKLVIEGILQDYHKAHPDFRFVILRYFNVAGAKMTGGLGQATKNAFQLVKLASEVATGKRAELKLFGTDYPTPDGTCVRDYIHVDDLAEAHILSLKYLNQGGTSQIMNCGYGKGLSVRDIIQTMKEVSGVDFKVVEAPRRAGDPATIYADNTRITEALNWKPKYQDVRVICRTSYEWEKTLS